MLRHSGSADTTLLNGQSVAQDMVEVSRRKGLRLRHQSSFLVRFCDISTETLDDSWNRMRVKKQKKLMNHGWQSVTSRFSPWKKQSRKQIVFALKLRKRTTL